jgi:hypothetical protein
VTGFEAISLEGADNLFIPLAVTVILGKITTKPLSEVVYQNLSLFFICLGVGLAVWRFRSLNVGGAISFILFAYGTWSLGSWVWALPVLVGFAGYLAAWLRFAPPGHASGVKVRTVARALLPPFTMLLLANMLQRYEMFFAPFLAASAAVLAFSLDTGVFRLEVRRSRSLGALGLALLGSLLAVAGPWIVAWRVVPFASLLAILSVAGVVALVNTAIELRDPALPRSREWTAWRFLLTFVAAGAMLGLQALGMVPAWDPGWR